MNIKIVLYIIFIPLVIWSMDGLNLNKIIKQSRIAQAKIIYLILSLIVSYLLVNFLYDFYINFRFIK